MIYGVGTDLVYLPTIKQMYEKHGEHFLNRCYHTDEIKHIPLKDDLCIGFLAKRFAAKEAVSKALGIGVGRGLFLQEICVEKNNLGKPCLALLGQSLKTFQALVPKGTIHLSLADHNEYASAFVVIESNHHL